jgi:hypothetical protein
MGSKWDRLLQSCVCIASSVYWRRDHASFREVDGMALGPSDYRAAGCMRLVRAAPPDFAWPASPPRVLTWARGVQKRVPYSLRSTTKGGDMSKTSRFGAGPYLT